MRKLKLIVLIFLLASLLAACGALPQSVTINLVEPTQDVNQIVQATFQALTQQASAPQPLATQAAPTSTSAATGGISGQLNYPASSIPPMYVTAYQVGTQNYQYVLTNAGQGVFKIDGLQPGTYHIIAYTVGGNGFPAGLSGGYTQAVPCGLTQACTDHTLIDVTVEAGKTVSDVKPFDWYAPAGTFQPFPQQASVPTPVPPSAEAATGSISGTLMYPAGGVGMPSLRIVAFQVGYPHYFHVDTALGQNTYQLDNLPPGTYRVIAYVLPGGAFTGGLPGGYTQAVPCGLQYSCNDHTLIDVAVTAGHVTTGVDPNDYYAPEGTFPPNPVP